MTGEPRHALQAESLTLAYDGRVVIDGLDLAIPDGRITAIVGPNASGKSTLLRGLGRLMRPQGGRVTLDGRDIRSYAPREFARRVAVLPQQPVAPDGVLVGELVARGRHPHRGWFGGRSSDDDRIVAEVLDATGTADLAGRSVSGSVLAQLRCASRLALAEDIHHLTLVSNGEPPRRSSRTAS